MLSSILGYPVDWDATGTMLQGLGTFAGVFAVIIGARIGASAWREQKQAERLMTMAEQIVIATYNARLALERIRAALVWGYELTQAEEKLKEGNNFDGHTPAYRARLVTAQALYDRINRNKEHELALDRCLPLARAMFNSELEAAIRELSHQFWLIQVDIDSYIDDELENDKEFSKKIRRGMYNIHTKEEPNERTQRINKLVGDIEAQCAPALRLEKARHLSSAARQSKSNAS